jgi:hypothetical protein
MASATRVGFGFSDESFSLISRSVHNPRDSRGTRRCCHPSKRRSDPCRVSEAAGRPGKSPASPALKPTMASPVTRPMRIEGANMKLHDESPGPSIFADLRSTTIALLSIVRGLDNKAAYDSRDAIAIMSASEELQLPELSIVERLDGWLDGKAMIDIGVGGGRTTHHFAPRVGRYLGIDYSTEIIKACEPLSVSYNLEPVAVLGPHDDATSVAVGVTISSSSTWRRALSGSLRPSSSGRGRGDALIERFQAASAAPLSAGRQNRPGTRPMSA